MDMEIANAVEMTAMTATPACILVQKKVPMAIPLVVME
jgi:hypothetical protein